jgi:hypothetical protein
MKREGERMFRRNKRAIVTGEHSEMFKETEGNAACISVNICLLILNQWKVR